jgi:hypothetical protein
MQVSDFLEDGFKLRACVVFGLKEPHPNVVSMVVDDVHVVVETMWEGDINWTPKVRGHVHEGTGWFSASSGVDGVHQWPCGASINRKKHFYKAG